MDFDDLDDEEAAQGPTPDELREELFRKAMPELIVHAAPEGKGFGKMGHLKMLYLHSMGSNYKMGTMQVSNMLVNAPRSEQDLYIAWTVLEGQIQSSAEGHRNPAVAELYKAYGPDFYSYIERRNYAQQLDHWTNFDKPLEHLADHLKKHGPYDGIMGFDQGACLAFQAAAQAQEGNAAFQNKFRFMIICSGLGKRPLVKDLAIRPKAPLQLPTLITFSEDCPVNPYTGYEELALFVEPSARWVIKHKLGHAPPKFDKDSPELKTLEKFLDAVKFGVDMYKPDMNEETSALKDFWLPLVRAPLPDLDTSAPRRLLVFTDPLGAHGPTSEELREDSTRPFDEDRETAAVRVKLLREVRGITVDEIREAAKAAKGVCEFSVEEMPYTQEHREMQWHPKEKRGCAWVDQEDEIVVPWLESLKIVNDILNELTVTRGESVAILGIGTGGHLARLMMEVLIKERGIVPVGLWLVAPPTIAPHEDEPKMGALVNCPVRYLTQALSTVGPPWRLELSTFGLFSYGLFQDKTDACEMVGKEVGVRSEHVFVQFSDVLLENLGDYKW